MVCLPIPPLRHEETTFYHSLTRKSTTILIYFFSAGAGCAGAAGAAGAVGAAAGAACFCAGMLPIGAGFDFAALDDMMEDPPPLPETNASDREVSMNMIAALVVSLLMNVLPPPAPNTDWLPLAPKDAPISAPFPDWRRTTIINAKLTVTCSATSRIVIKSVTSEKFQQA
jgi:hypothetical protein